jgi:hypothetical protein
MSIATPYGYVLRVAGHLDPHWRSRFGDLELTHHDDGTSTLAGPVADQAQLHGLLAGLRDIGATLLSVQPIDQPDPDERSPPFPGRPGRGPPQAARKGDRMNYRKIATFTGWLWIITFVTSIPARLFFYAPVLDHEGGYITGAGSDARTLIGIGAVLELLLIISNVGTAVVPYSIHKRVHEAGAVAYVAARLVECTFIAIGIVAILAISTLRQDAPAGADAAVGQGIFALYDWTFRIGPGVFAGIGNGLILGWLMYRSGLVPPRFALFGLIGGPLVSLVGFLVVLGVLPAEGPAQVLVAPEFIWELGIGIYLIVKGYRTSSPALAGTQQAVT